MTEYQHELETERSMKDQFMAHHAESPFISGRVHDFSGLRYFPVDEKFRLRARLRRVSAPQEAYLRTNRDGQAVMRYLGDLAFTWEGEEHSLRVYHAGEGVGPSVFIPFRDTTCGSESYGAGRYLTLELSEDDSYELDFNRAFNPYCAYTEAFECPFPPVENDLPIAIRAGERAWRPSEAPAPVTGRRSPRRAPKSRAPLDRRRARSARRPTPARKRPTPRR